jgi:hypothetical protein
MSIFTCVLFSDDNLAINRMLYSFPQSMVCMPVSEHWTLSGDFETLLRSNDHWRNSGNSTCLLYCVMCQSHLTQFKFINFKVHKMVVAKKMNIRLLNGKQGLWFQVLNAQNKYELKKGTFYLTYYSFSENEHQMVNFNLNHTLSLSFVIT